MTTDFDPKTFYRFINTEITNYTLSAGIFLDTNGAIGMNESDAYSSENWQLFPQGGRYFIRNYDYGPSFQLGLTSDNRGTPALYPRSGSVAQQWSIMKVDGGWQLANGLLGNGTELGVFTGDAMTISMGAFSGGKTWVLDQNDSAKTNGPNGTEMYSEVQNFEVIQSSSSLPSSLSTSTTATPSGTSVLPSSTSTSSISPSSPSSSLSGGAIAGIAIGGVAVLALVIFGVWFWARKRKAAIVHRYELQASHGPAEKYAYRAELETPRQVLEKESVERRVELP